MTTIPDNFLGLPVRYSDYRRARFAVLPVPYDSTASFQVGTRDGPRAILTASQQVELFDEELDAEWVAAGIATLPPLAPQMGGPAEQVEAVYTAARRVVRDGKFLLGLGGEHSITSGLVRAVARRHRDLSVLQLDAHADLRDEWEGTPWSHACVMRRIVDLGLPIVPVGIRNYSRQEHAFMRRRGIRPVPAREIPMQDAPAAAPAEWMQRAVAALTRHVYVTIDIDCFDPAYAPGTGTPEPDGMNWRQVTALLREVARARQIVAADVVEVMPLPGTRQTEFLAAKLAYKLIAYVQRFSARLRA